MVEAGRPLCKSGRGRSGAPRDRHPQDRAGSGVHHRVRFAILRRTLFTAVLSVACVSSHHERQPARLERAPAAAGTASRPAVAVSDHLADARKQPLDPREVAERVASLHHPKTPPRPGEWLADHAEPGQTFFRYRHTDPNRPDAHHTTFYLQPIGGFDSVRQQVLEATADFLGRYYGVAVRTSAPLAASLIPKTARRVHPTWGERQVLTGFVLDDLVKPRRPADAVAVLGLTTEDLWPGDDWNFVFGEASLDERVGVHSLHRYGDPRKSDADHRRFLRRTLKVAVHESGHMLGIEHCTAYECVMNGSNDLGEMDSRPIELCPEDAQKVWWATGVDPLERWQKLIEFADAHGLDEESKLWRESLRLAGG